MFSWRQVCLAAIDPHPSTPFSRRAGRRGLRRSRLRPQPDKPCETRAMQRDSNARFHHNNVPAARELRARGTRAEEVLWQELRSRRLGGLKFRRQHPIGPFVLDFCCVERRLAIEVDGGVHGTLEERDAERESLLVAAGFRVLRFSNDDVQQRLSQVLESIQTAAQVEPPSRPKAPGRRAGWS